MTTIPVTVKDSPRGESTADALAQALRARMDDDRRAYLLVDAARSADIRPVLETLSDDALCLFDGEAFENLAEVAPWLVPLTLEMDDPFDWFMEDGWGHDWGVFLMASPDAAKVKSSLKRSIMVRDEDDRAMYFKFYRPSVFNAYLPEFEPDQAAYVMRDLLEVWTEAPDDPSMLRRYAMRDGALRRADLRLVVEEDA